MMNDGVDFNQFDARESRRLREARVFSNPDLPLWPAVVQLTFDEFSVFVCVEPEFDTLVCSRELPDSYQRSASVMIAASFWDSVLGWTLADAWQMRNDRGYMDALQLRFREYPDKGAYRHVQLWAFCSSIRLLEFHVAREEPAPGTPAA